MKRRALFVAGLMAAALVVASGMAWAASINCPNRAGNLCVGTDNKDTMTGRDGRTDDMRAKGGADEVRGRGGADTLSGGPGADTLTSGLGKDTLAGAEGPNVLKGGSADDTYKFGINNGGKDTITDTPSSDNDPDTGNFSQFGSPNQFLSTRLTIDLTSSANEPEVKNGILTVTVNWSNNAIDGVYVGSITDDTINGNASANTIVSNIGEDSDDTINAKGAMTGSASWTSLAGTRWTAVVRPTTKSSTTKATR